MTMEKTELNTSVNEELQDEYVSEHISVIDFKMITFSLAEKDYAIDIMKVKEIAKANNFTYVPNTAPFVLGVYNLRGDIIPIIDLRIFSIFRLNNAQKILLKVWLSLMLMIRFSVSSLIGLIKWSVFQKILFNRRTLFSVI